jgi:hypothetical protein
MADDIPAADTAVGIVAGTVVPADTAAPVDTAAGTVPVRHSDFPVRINCYCPSLSPFDNPLRFNLIHLILS